MTFNQVQKAAALALLSTPISPDPPEPVQPPDLIHAAVEPPEDKGNISDGYHTFNELYAHRFALWIAVCRLVQRDPQYQYREAWRCKFNSDGSSYPGMFLLAMTTEDGKQLSYHLPLSKWEECDFAFTYDKPQPFDGHTSEDVIERLGKL